MPRVPLLSIELSSRCNLKCPYCANATLKREYGRMEDALLDRIVDEAVREKYYISGLHGVGEPLLRPDITQVLSRIHRAGVWSGQLTTNGTLLSLEKMRELVGAGLRSLYVSLDTFEPALYQRTRGGPVARVIENIRQAAQAFPELEIQVALMDHREQTVDDSLLQEFYRVFEGRPNVVPARVINTRLPGAREDWRRLDPETGAPFMVMESCCAPAFYFTVDIHGNAVLCCADQNSQHKLGNVMDRPIRDIWFDAENQETFRRIFLGLEGCPAVCHQCILKPSRRTLADIDPVLALPYAGLRRHAMQALQDGDAERALLLFDKTQQRSPYDHALSSAFAAAFPEHPLVRHYHGLNQALLRLIPL